MRKYADERDRRAHHDFLKGGKHELAALLRSEAQMTKGRFARLALRVEDAIAPEDFGAILSGITSTQTEGSDSPEVKELKQRQLAVSEIVPVIERTHAIAPEQLAKDICRAIKSVANREPPPQLLPILIDYALHHPNPEKEEWRETIGGGGHELERRSAFPRNEFCSWRCGGGACSIPFRRQSRVSETGAGHPVARARSLRSSSFVRDTLLGRDAQF